MSRTRRAGNRRDGLRIPKFLKEDDRYTGWVGEDIWDAKSKKRHKRVVGKHNRRVRKSIDTIPESWYDGDNIKEVLE